MLIRGKYGLPYHSQQVRRDFAAEEISRHFGSKANAYRRSVKQMEENPPHGYEYLISSPDSAGRPWCAFRTRDEMQLWLDAYGLTLNREPEPGQGFDVLLPADESAFQTLHDGMVHVVSTNDDAYVFPPGDDRWATQYTVCIGSNLDAETYTVRPEVWEQAKSKLRDAVPGITIHDFTEPD